MLLEKIKQAIAENNWNMYDIAVLDANGIHTLQNQPANACNNSYSVAKLFTVTALGMLWDAGKLDFEERIRDIFSEEFPKEYDPNWDKVTVDHVMRHRFGTDSGYLDIDVEDINSYGTDDFLQVVFRQPLPHEPDTHFQYSDAAYYLLSRVVTKKTGEKLDDFLMSRLFWPLRYQEVAWSKCPKGYPMGATGLYIRAQDMVKLGGVYLYAGEYGSRRYLSREFVRLAMERGYELGKVGDTGVCGKGGMCGQMLLLSQAAGVSVAWHGCEEAGNPLLMKKVAGWLAEMR